MSSEPFGPFAIDPAWRRRGPTSAPGAIEKPADRIEKPENSPPLSAVAPELPTPGKLLPETPLPEKPAERSPDKPAVRKAPPQAPMVEAAELLPQVKVSGPRPEENPEPPPFKPDPLPEPAATPPKRRRRVRLDGVIPYLAALVGLIALGGAIYLDQQSRARTAAISTQLGEARTALEALARQVAAPPPPQPAPVNDGTIDALLALQNRVMALEGAAVAPASGTASTAAAAAPAAAGQTVLTDGPTEDCIPIGTRFVALPGESYPICRTTATVKVSAISPDQVVLANGTSIVSGGSAALRFGNCVISVLSSDANGFAELKVSCT